MICSSCSKPIADGSGLCVHCATPVVPRRESTGPRPEASSRTTQRHTEPPTPHPRGHKESELRFEAGKLITDRYRIVRLVGRGGMGEVYQAKDLTLGQSVALKFLPETVETDTGFRAHLFDEVRLARKISHPNVCRVHDIGEIDGVLFLSMELIEGETLAKTLERDTEHSDSWALELAHQICRGLAAAHEEGILHRDLKPANLMLDRAGKVRITDFGLAITTEKIEDDDHQHGTPAYMAPEVLRGEIATVRSDIYSLGLVLYKLFTGELPFTASSIQELNRFHLTVPPPPPTTFKPELDSAIERVILRCLEKEPSRRPYSALAVSAALPGGARLDPAARRILLVTELIGRRHWAETFGNEVAQRLETLHTTLVGELLAEHGGHPSEGPAGAPLVFERPIHAVRYALAYQAKLHELAADHGDPALRLDIRAAIHLGEVIFAESLAADDEIVSEALRLDWETVDSLRSLATRHQILLTRQAFDLARQTTAAELEGVRWLAHGSYELEGCPEPLEIFEVGHEGHAPLHPPPDSVHGRRQMVQETVGGWRPAPGLELPQRPRWFLERKLDSGGFGEVWLARHHKTADRRIFKFCYDARRLRALQREITLFRLLKEELGERDDIARIFDWSFEEAPYFIEAEYTAGGDLKAWMERHGGIKKVDLETRLDLVAQIATALAAAHSVGVLHKDVKPSNVLIHREVDGGLRARLADFGIGSLTEPQRLDQAGITVLGMTESTESSDRTGSQDGTRLYMAPETFGGRRATLQADIYALGVVLYQMVIGDFTRALGPGWERDVRDDLLREDIAAAADVLPERRLSSATQLAERLRSLEQRRDERDRLARERQEARQAHEALARGRRRRRAMILALVLMAIFAGTIWIQSKRIVHEATTRAWAFEFLFDLFELPDPERESEREITAQELLDNAYAKIKNDTDAEPHFRASVMHYLGRIYGNLGEYGPATELLKEALEIRRQRHDSNHPDVAETLAALADVLYHQGDYESARRHASECLQIRRRELGPKHPDVSDCLELLGRIHREIGAFEDADLSFREALQIRTKALGSDHPDVADVLVSHGSLLIVQRQLETAKDMLQRAVDIRRTQLRPTHPDLAQALFRLGMLHSMQGSYETAEPIYREALAIWNEAFDGNHLVKVQIQNRLARLYHQWGDRDQDKNKYTVSEQLYEDTLRLFRELELESHPWYPANLSDLAALHQSRGDLPRSVRLYEEALAAYRREDREDSVFAALIASSLAEMRHLMGETEGVLETLRASLPTIQEGWGESSQLAANTHVQLGRVLLDRSAFSEAEDQLRTARGIYSKIPSDAWRRHRADALIGAALVGQGRTEEGSQRLLAARQSLEELHGLQAERAAEEAQTYLDSLHQD